MRGGHAPFLCLLELQHRASTLAVDGATMPWGSWRTRGFWETTSERLRAYFENFGVVREAFVSYNRNNGRPRGFGFVVFESMDVADKVVSTKHTIDRREAERKPVCCATATVRSPRIVISNSTQSIRTAFDGAQLLNQQVLTGSIDDDSPSRLQLPFNVRPHFALLSCAHTQVECKKAVPKEEQQGVDSNNTSPPSSTGEGSSSAAAAAANTRTRKVFVGGLAPAVDDAALLQHFEQFGPVEDAVVMYDHDNKRPRGFGFVTFANEDSVDKVFGRGAMQSIADKQIEIKPA
eukprot:1095828-Pelagomonas_calceolata.AAC.1